MIFTLQQLKENIITDSRYDPFNSSFDAEEIRQKIKSFDEIEQGAIDLLMFSELANTTYRQCESEIQTWFAQSGLSKNELLILFFSVANKEFNKTSSMLDEQNKNTGISTGIDIHLHFKFEDAEGHSVPINTPLELQVDILSVFLERLDIWTKNPMEEAVNISGENEDHFERFQKLWSLANLIHNLRDNIYPRLIYENGRIEWQNENNVKVISSYPGIDFIRTANDIRTSNQSLETLINLQTFIKKIGPRKYLYIDKVDKGVASLQIGKIRENETNGFMLSGFVKYHAYLANIKLDYFKGLTLANMVKLLTTIVEMMKSFNSKEINPVCIVEVELLDGLCKCHEFSREQIRKFIDTLIADNLRPYFWRKPFYREGDKLFFSLFALYTPNVANYCDEWLKYNQFSQGQQIKSFKDSVRKEITNSKTKYPIYFIELKNALDEEGVFESSLLLKLPSKLLLLEIVVFKFPIESQEHEQVLNLLGVASLEIIQKREVLLKAHADLIDGNEILVVLLTSCPVYSGMQINNIPICDLTLLNNYLIVGKFKKGLLFETRLGLKSKDIGSISYYHNEIEFGDRLNSFLKKPIPVYSLIETMKMVEREILPPITALKITTDVVNYLTEEELNETRVKNISDLIVYNHFVEPKDEIKISTDESIYYLLSIHFSNLANSNNPDSARPNAFLPAHMKGNEIGLSYLVYYLLKTVAKQNWAIAKKKKFKNVDLEDPEKAGTLLLKMFAHLKGDIALSDFEIPKIYTRSEEAQLIAYAEVIISHHAYQRLNENRIFTMMIALCILKSHTKKTNTTCQFYIGCSNFVDLLNQSSYYQKARDFCEELLIVASNRGENAYAWNILFACYSAQMNAFDAAVYGSLFFTSLMSYRKIPHELGVNGFSNLLKFCRNFGYYEYADSVYKMLPLDLMGNYDNQKISILYFHTVLKNASQHPDKLQVVFDYLNRNMKSIKKYPSHATFPWLTLLYSIENEQKKGELNSSFEIKQFITDLESVSNPTIVSEMRQLVFGVNKGTKNSFIKAILHSLESRHSGDFTFEVTQLAYLTNNLIEHSFKTGDTEGILLASLALSDLSFSYRNISLEDHAKVNLSEPGNQQNGEKINNYQAHLLAHLQLTEKQKLLWLFEFKHKVGYLMIDHLKNIKIGMLPVWDIRESKVWASNLTEFYFNSKGRSGYDLSAQEADYNKCLKDLAFTTLPRVETEELLICSSPELMEIPHQLFISGDDFVTSSTPICNVLSVEYIMEHGNLLHLPKTYRTEAWIPTDDGNSVVSWGYELLLPVLTRSKAAIDTGSRPAKRLQGDLNIFLAHGIRDFSGFKAVRTNDSSESSIFYPSSVFGKGTLAILFICNSGSSVEKLYARQIISFSGELLKAGYSAVIAPCWPYDVTMSRRWLTTFLASFNEGISLNRSVFLANNSLAAYDEANSNQFFAPQGRFAMHLFGNPNITVDQTVK